MYTLDPRTPSLLFPTPPLPSVVQNLITDGRVANSYQSKRWLSVKIIQSDDCQKLLQSISPRVLPIAINEFTSHKLPLTTGEVLSSISLTAFCM